MIAKTVSTAVKTILGAAMTATASNQQQCHQRGGQLGRRAAWEGGVEATQGRDQRRGAKGGRLGGDGGREAALPCAEGRQRTSRQSGGCWARVGAHWLGAEPPWTEGRHGLANINYGSAGAHPNCLETCMLAGARPTTLPASISMFASVATPSSSHFALSSNAGDCSERT